ncbi:hypothetical protein PC116_g24339 [Phytophthora cactorum]|nr:hypothetical protein PC114_g21961 [Phytophthora cactorum]KAG2979287.1 hypothetical protein PC119_g21517 [Phytophthora cactorum]KAG2998817.1 hypothetical protein PC120_g21061 [Phytophthora cactorum]KAG3134388.1 hypothetical protein C6341_g22183 [Phytophthora cactorum]KAG3153034.1 hypothetical protein PC128_g22643 [Phytophthora cactorum]
MGSSSCAVAVSPPSKSVGVVDVRLMPVASAQEERHLKLLLGALAEVGDNA